MNAPEIRDIAGPVAIPLLEPWQWAVVGAASAGLLAALAWWLWSLWRARPAPPSPTAREKAIAALGVARGRMGQTSAYDFSIALSEILRTFCEEFFGIAATHQTTPEFLSALAGRGLASGPDRDALADFLQACDRVKFARAEAGEAECLRLLDGATAFVNRSQPVRERA